MKVDPLFKKAGYFIEGIIAPAWNFVFVKNRHLMDRVDQMDKMDKMDFSALLRPCGPLKTLFLENKAGQSNRIFQQIPCGWMVNFTCILFFWLYIMYNQYNQYNQYNLKVYLYNVKFFDQKKFR